MGTQNELVEFAGLSIILRNRENISSLKKKDLLSVSGAIKVANGK
jgi:hypothetical protein